MTTAAQMIPAAEALPLQTLVRPTEQGIASRILAKASGGNVTLFAFDAGQGLTEHTSPFDALVMVLEGALTLTIGAPRSGPLRGPSCGCPRVCRTASTLRNPRGCCSSCCGTPRARRSEFT